MVCYKWGYLLNPFMKFLIVFLRDNFSILNSKWGNKYWYILLPKKNLVVSLIKFCHSNNSNGKDLTVLFKVGLSWDISKLSLISKLILLQSLDKTVRSSKFMLQSKVSKWCEISWLLDIVKTFVHPVWNSHIFCCSSIKMALCFAIINSAAVITLKIINDARAEFFGKHILTMKIVDNFRRWSENDF